MSPQHGRTCLQSLELEQRKAAVPSFALLNAVQLSDSMLCVVSLLHVEHRKYVPFFLFTSHVLKPLAKCLQEFEQATHSDVTAGFCSHRVRQRRSVIPFQLWLL